VAVQRFIAFPDSEGSAATADSLDFPGFPRKLHYPSGRVGLIGYWLDDEVAVANIGDIACFALGTLDKRDGWLLRALHLYLRTNDLRSFDAPGSFHLIVRTKESLLIRGTLSALRSVHYAKVGSVTIASSHARLLAEMTGARVDPGAVARKLLSPRSPSLLETRAMWGGINTAPPGHVLRIDLLNSAASTNQYWRAPSDLVPLSEGAQYLSEALRRATEVRSARHDTLVCDLSGGLDSTSLFHLALDSSPNLAAFTSGTLGTMASELKWAKVGLGGRNVAKHIVLDPGKVPFPFDAISSPAGSTDEPHLGEILKSRTHLISSKLASSGMASHLMGHGGDELFASSPAFIGDALKSGRLFSSLKRLRQYSALRRIPASRILRHYVRPWDYAKELEEQARAIATAGERVDSFKMGGALSMPAWVTYRARHEVANFLRDSSVSTMPFSATRHQHEILERVWAVATNMRHDSILMAQSGIRCELPFLDDEVIHAALAVEPLEINDPARYKPLLGEAMRGIIPEEVRLRTTKTEATSEIWEGMKRNRQSIEQICTEMVLDGLGLVDENMFKRCLLGPQDPRVQISAYWATVSTEVWLRDALNLERTP